MRIRLIGVIESGKVLMSENKETMIKFNAYLWQLLSD